MAQTGNTLALYPKWSEATSMQTNTDYSYLIAWAPKIINTWDKVYEINDDTGKKWFIRYNQANKILAFECTDESDYLAGGAAHFGQAFKLWLSQSKLNQHKIGVAGSSVSVAEDLVVDTIYYTLFTRDDRTWNVPLMNIQSFVYGIAGNPIDGNKEYLLYFSLIGHQDGQHDIGLPAGDMNIRQAHSILFMPKSWTGNAFLETTQLDKYYLKPDAIIEWQQRTGWVDNTPWHWYPTLKATAMHTDPLSKKTYKCHLVRGNTQNYNPFDDYDKFVVFNFINNLDNPLDKYPLHLGYNLIIVKSETNPANYATVSFVVTGKAAGIDRGTTALGTSLTSININYTTVDNSSDILASEFMFGIKSAVDLTYQFWDDRWSAYADVTFGWNQYMRFDQVSYDEFNKPLFQRQQHTEFVSPQVNVSINGRNLGKMVGNVSGSTMSFVLPEDVYIGNDVRYDRWPYTNFQEGK